jgi:hypothetical protein
VKARTGRIVDREQDDGGWPPLRSRPAPRDSDGDGMPDRWERRHRLDPARQDGAEDCDGDGWTNFEDYLNNLVPPPPAATAAGRHDEPTKG